MPNRHKPIGNTDETLLIRYEETSEVAKTGDVGYIVVSFWVCEIKKIV